ncbi:MAG: toll/interleukin-1 receptor domain-containing protein, partial [Propionibacteriaceae bacterium]|nr:toll/interleukin-1 receptor domain-containing protein [Propionibacteriaceae bacterium]
MAVAWDAFISYARADSERTAIAVQRGLQRFARPWNQRRAVRVFRDDSAMSTNPALWSAIEAGLAAAGHLIVLLGPAARESAYVEKEVGWWVEHKGTGSILLALGAGDLAWDRAGDRFTADSDVPPCLREAFAEEPRWLDLRWMADSPAPSTDPRFAAAMADLSAPIRGVPRDDLIGEDLTQHRRVRRLARSAVSLLVLLLAVSVVATVIAVRQRDDVLRQAVTLRSRALASTASGLLDSELRLAQLVAVQGFRTEDSAATRQALLQADFASPLVAGFTTFDADIAAIATSADSSTVAVGLSDGRVYTVAGAGAAAPVLRFTATAPVTTLRVSADGAVLLVGTRDGVTVWDRAGSRMLPGGDDPVSAESIALSASGLRAGVVRQAARSSVAIYDTTTGAEVARHTDPLAPGPDVAVPYPQFTERLAFLDDQRLRLVGNDARWVELELGTGATSRAGSAIWTPYADLYVTSSRADFLLAAPITNGQQVRAWPMGRSGRRPPQTAGVQLTDPLGIAISPDGRLVLVNDSSTGLSVAPVAGAEEELPVVPATRIAGLTGVAAMEFVGPTRAVAAARTELVFLSFGGVGRGASSAKLSPRGVGGVPEYAVDYRNSRMAVSPDGSRVAVLEVNSAELEIVPLAGRGAAELPRTSLGLADQLGSLFGVAWLDNGTVLVLSSEPGGVVSGLPDGVLRWNLGLPVVGEWGDRETPIAATPTGAGTVLVATSGGVVQTRARATGELVRELESGAPGAGYELGRFTADGSHLALIDDGDRFEEDGTRATPATLLVVDSVTGGVIHEQRWPESATGVAGLEFAGTTLLVSHLDGSVDVLPDLGRGPATRISTAGTRTSTGSSQLNPPVVGAGGLVGFPTRSGLQLYDLTTLQPSAELPVPPGFEAVPRTYAFAPDGHTLVTGFFGADARTAAVSVRDLDTEAV